MRGRLRTAAAGGSLLLLLYAGCGGDDTPQPEPKLGDQAEGRQERRIEQLERRGAELRRRNRGSVGHSGAGGAGLGGFDELARTLPGEVGVAVGPPGASRASRTGALQSGTAWSTIKLPIALGVLKEAGGPGGLDAGLRGEIERAITASDNGAAAQLFEYLGRRHGGAAGATRVVTEVLRAAGDGTTQVSTQGRAGFSPYGQTEWSLEAQEQFMAALAGGCVGDAASRRYLLDVMGRVTSDRWGLGAAGVTARWKGGWGPGTDGRYLARQMGVLQVGGRQLVVTIAARASDGQFASAQRMASSVAAWVGKRAGRLAAAPAGC